METCTHTCSVIIVVFLSSFRPSDAPLDLRVKSNLIADLFSLAGKLS